MEDGQKNLFTRLYKLARANHQGENFITESLAIVLEQLLLNAPGAGTGLVRDLTCGFINVDPSNAATIKVATQVHAGNTIPDLEISTRCRLASIEVKVTAPLGKDQLGRYQKRLLNDPDGRVPCFILLSILPMVFASEAKRPDHELQWFQVGTYIDRLVPQKECQSNTA